MTSGDNRAKGASVELGLRKQNTQAEGHTVCTLCPQKHYKKTEGEAVRETPAINARTNEGASKT